MNPTVMGLDLQAHLRICTIAIAIASNEQAAQIHADPDLENLKQQHEHFELLTSNINTIEYEHNY
jgi:hypothetical protein